jgi:hypothetical protein
MVFGVQVEHHQKETLMHQFRLGPKAIQEIQKFQGVLARFPRKERISMVRYLGQAQAITVPASLARTNVVSLRRGAGKAAVTGATKWTSRQRKLSKVAKARKRDASGHFVPAKRSVRSARAA